MLHSNATPEAERYRYKTMRHRHTWPRRIAKLVAAPLYFMYESGQARSILRARSVDKHGNPIPMLTYPANDFLQSVELELRNADVLEFGCGQSTLWLAPRVNSLLGVEPHPEFRALLQKQFESDPRIRFIDKQMPFDIHGTFDIIILDGSPRVAAGKFAPTVLKEDGMIVFDNSDFQSLSEVPEHLHDLGFGRVDFLGHSPTGVRRQGTSIFFRSLKWFRINRRVPPVSPHSLTWNESGRHGRSVPPRG